MGFSKDFLWGAASAAHQVEGGYLDDGKGMGIWDTFEQKGGYIAHGETGAVSTDHYHRFKEDVALMKQIGLKSYRFSISWPRVLPEGTGNVNETGLQFYVDLTNELIQAGIEPLVTLYHWNLPTALYEKGGWKNPEIVAWFEEYTDVVTKALSGKVKYWMTFNEPQVFAAGGYLAAFHAPFEQVDEAEFMQISKDIFLAHGKAVQKIRANCPGAKVGYAPSNPCVIPEKETPEKIEEARKLTFGADEKAYGFRVSWWSDPLILGKFPEEAKEAFGDRLPEISEEEWKEIAQPLDFYGFNVYQGDTAEAAPPADGYDRYSYCGSPKTAMDWNVTPAVLYWCCKFYYERYHLPLLITENGMANYDWKALDGGVHDPARIDFVHRYLLNLKRAVDEGIPVIGYQYWSLMDNLEWTFGYDKRFGMIYVDYRTLERTLKDSAYWYRDMIEENGENL